jgi:hypothetical protein
MIDETSITVRFNKPVTEFTAEDRDVILRRLRAYMRKFDPKTTNRRRKVDPRQIEETAP